MKFLIVIYIATTLLHLVWPVNALFYAQRALTVMTFAKLLR
jgi:hypothetical protein